VVAPAAVVFTAVSVTEADAPGTAWPSTVLMARWTAVAIPLRLCGSGSPALKTVTVTGRPVKEDGWLALSWRPRSALAVLVSVPPVAALAVPRKVAAVMPEPVIPVACRAVGADPRAESSTVTRCEPLSTSLMTVVT
jgi:hypothetical protein